MAYQTFLHEYMQIPIVTRVYTTACVITTIAVATSGFLCGLKLLRSLTIARSATQIKIHVSFIKCYQYVYKFNCTNDTFIPLAVTTHLDIVSPFQLYFNPTLIVLHYQLWRLVTTFLFFGTIGFNFLFNMTFTYRYCRMLEEGSFRGKSSDFIMMFFFGGTLMIIFAFFVNLLFLGQAFTIMLVYVWSRRNPFIRMNFFGILNFLDLMGMAVGHVYYFLEDVFPKQRGGFRILKTPLFLRKLFDEAPEDADYAPLPEDRPGGFNWGEDRVQNDEN